VPDFGLQFKRLRRSIDISGKSQSTLTNYGRCLAHMGLHLQCDLLELDDEQILDYLHRIIEVGHDEIKFSAKDYRKGGKKHIVALKAIEFIRRFAMHNLSRRSGFYLKGLLGSGTLVFYLVAAKRNAKPS
jgi:hypothetical protein